MKCIWCLKEDPEVAFKRSAHIFPKSLGGVKLCKNVCDNCNQYFGSKQASSPSVEIALKEPLAVSKFLLLNQTGNKSFRLKSEYFKFDDKQRILSLKFKYRTITEFQEKITKLFKRGVYKIFLEERSESVGDSFDSRFDFIRHYARYGIGDYPIYYCRPKFPAVFVSKDDIGNPVIRFTSHSEEVMRTYGFYSYRFIAHELAFPVISQYDITSTNYHNFMLGQQKSMYKEMVLIKEMSDLDFTFAKILS